MLNPNNQPVLTLEEKCAPIPGGLVPLTIAAYDKKKQEFTIAADERYYEEGRDTNFYGISDTVVPSFLILAVIGEDIDYQTVDELVGICILIDAPLDE